MPNQQAENSEFETKGFLSKEISQVIADIRQNNLQWFDLTEATNECIQTIAMRAVQSVHGTTLDPKVLATFLLLRSTSMIQSVIMHAERGMAVEARIMIRSLLENAFCIALITQNPSDFVKRFEDDDTASRKAQIKFILDNGLGNPSNINALQAKLDELKGKALQIKDLAAQGPLSQQYLIYRVLSNDSAHPSATSLKRHLNIAPQGAAWIGYKLGSATDLEVAQVLKLLMLAAMPIGIGYTDIVPDAQGKSDLGQIVSRYEILKDTVDWSAAA